MRHGGFELNDCTNGGLQFYCFDHCVMHFEVLNIVQSPTAIKMTPIWVVCGFLLVVLVLLVHFKARFTYGQGILILVTGSPLCNLRFQCERRNLLI